jgi:hypothetical protein
MDKAAFEPSCPETDQQTPKPANANAAAGRGADGEKGSRNGRGSGEVYGEGYYRTIYEAQRGSGTGVPFARLSQDAIQKVLNAPWTSDGLTFRTKSEVTGNGC